VILQSPDGGETLLYGKPIFYPLYLAPFVRVAPIRGPLVANVLLLGLAVILACRTMRRRLGWSAPLWGAAFVFASVTFAHVFWIHADLFLMSLVALALAAVYARPGGVPEEANRELPEIWEDPETDSRRRLRLRWAGAGLLLGVVAMARPFYGALLLPAALAAWRSEPWVEGRRWRNLLPLAAGVLLTFVLVGGSNLATRDTWTSYGGVRHAFYSYTGFPGVELTPADWQQRSAERGTNSWLRGVPPTPDPRRLGWNGVYLLVGRHVGLLPYFLPLLICLLAYRGDRGRWALLLAVAAALACFLWVRPVNFFGGGGSLANRYFLPLYPAFWFLPARDSGARERDRRGPTRRAWIPALPLLASLASAPFLLPLWTAPRAYPLAEEGGLRHVSTFARHWLPYETTQSHLKPSGQEDVLHGDLWIKPLTPGIVPQGPEGQRLRLPADGGELLLGSAVPLESVWVRCAPPGPARLEVAGGEVGEILLRPNGASLVQITLGRPRARHPMWWGRGDIYLYRLRLALPEDLPERPSAFSISLRPSDSPTRQPGRRPPQR
jgi:hypothetical protein